MLQMISGFWVSRCIYAAAELGLADHIQQPTSVEDLAAKLKLHGRSLYRLLRALASVGIFRETDSGQFEATPLSNTLRSDAPRTFRSLARMELGHDHYACWGELLYSVQTGKPSFDKIYDKPVFDWYAEHPERSKVFNQAMSELTAVAEPAVLKAYDFSDCGTIVDVGGCFGSLLIPILSKHKHLHGVVFDAPNVVTGAAGPIRAAGLSDRLSMAAGDFFQAVPAGGDTYIMKHIIHDWNDVQCVQILKNCHAVMKPGSRVLILESVLPGANQPSFGKFVDLIMLQMPGGAERTEPEFDRLLTQAGFKLNRIVPTESHISVIEGVRQ